MEGGVVGSFLTQVFGREYVFGFAQDGVFGGVIGVFFGWDFQNGRNGALVGIERVSYYFCDVLVDKDDVNVISVQKLFVGRDEKGVFRVVYFKLVGWVVEENGFDFESIEDRGKGDYIKFFLFYLELIFFKS